MTENAVKKTPAALFEVSWEVCNKVGGIHTVVLSKAQEAVKRFGDNYFLIGPLRDVNPGFVEGQPGDADSAQCELFRRAAAVHGLKCRFGRWAIPGSPKVILIDWKGRYNQNQLLYDLWHDYGVDSLRGAWDYIEPVMFSTVCGEAIATFAGLLTDASETELSVAAHFHEWMCGAGLLYLKKHAPKIATVFTTHATVLGRSMAGNGRDIYSQMDQINPAQEAANYGVVAKHSMEAAAARECDCFTTVSNLTAHEAAAYLGVRPDLVTLNGLSLNAIPDYSAERSAAISARARILTAVSRLLRRDLPADTRLLLISGRYEYHNKGVDLFLDSLAELNRSRPADQPPVLALIAVMGGHNGVSSAAASGDPSQKPPVGPNWIATHSIFDLAHDPIVSRCLELGLDNRPENPVQVVFNPAQLDGNDGFFNMTYDEVLSACDCGVFPSWYEPWGYTPQEAAAFAVPTVTSDLAGFGQWVREQDECIGTAVIERAHVPYEASVRQLARELSLITELTDEQLLERRAAVRALATESDWTKFYAAYDEAYALASRFRTERITNRPMAKMDDELLTRVFSGTPSATPLLHGFTSTAKLPEPLSRLAEFARNMWWTWHPEYEPLFSTVDPAAWEQNGHSAVALLEKTDHSRFVELAQDEGYLALYRRALAEFDAEMNAPFDESVANLDAKHPIAYFSTEYGIHESLPIYSGGLGVLSGDHLKSASDLRMPLVAVGLLYRCGYFVQQISHDGRQQALYPSNDFRMLPLRRVRNQSTGEHLYVSLDLPGRTLYARVWEVKVGRISLYLLDTDTPKNTEEDRRVTERLYVADRDTRIRQEILLGMGGPKALAALGLHPRAYHMNEGHSAFMILERIHHLCLTRGLSFEAAREVVRGDSVFTTHTPVDAGNERFSENLMHRYFDSWTESLGLKWDDLRALGCRDGGTDFEMTLLALNHAVRSNGVSRLHGSVSRAMWQFNWKGVPTEEIPIGHVTNGVHLASFTGPSIARLLNGSVGKDWKYLPASAPQWAAVEELPDDQVWAAKQEQKKALFDLLRAASPKSFQQASAEWKQTPLVIGFARRFAPYKRATLVMADMQRLLRILSDSERPVILVFSGKAHPADTQGGDLIQQVVRASRNELAGKLFFIPNYNLDTARTMVQGCDVWLNNPRRPYEASGTSGQKAAPNGTLNLSISDGWWCEGDNGRNGWTIGPRVTSIHDLPSEQSDYADADSLYSLLEDEVTPMFFSRGDDGLPHEWIARMKNSIATLAPEYNSARMVRDYFAGSYRPAAERHLALRAENRLLPRAIATWKKDAGARFAGTHIEQIRISGLVQNSVPCTDTLTVSATVVPGAMKPEELLVQFVAGRSDTRDFTEKPDVADMTCTGADERGHLTYTVTYTPSHNGHYLYGVRVMPWRDGLDNPLDSGMIQWG
ncbi:MAG: alpha-glucan family phosphorylase [Pyramidobacter sp.]|nr:alpha-glucan family phosphorylase [Pyramidobacter sp.]